MSTEPKRRSHSFRNFLLLFIVAVVAASYLLPDEQPAAVSNPGGSEARMVALTGGNFQSAIRNGIYVVDFWAEWCGPCKIQDPIIASVAQRYAGRVQVAKVDVDREGDLAQRLGIQAIPTIIIFKNGTETGRFTGVTDENDLSEAIRYTL